MSIITLTSDFGRKDHFVGALKGKIMSSFPEGRLVDISHEIDPFNIYEASYIISAAYSSFPKNTVHIIGVDAELHKENKHIAMRWNDQYFICADNGILSFLTSTIKPEKIVEINIHNQLPEDSTDLDIFVQVACHLAKGGLLQVIGKEIRTLKEIHDLPAVVASDKSYINGYVIYIDHFGNAVVNISKKLFTETQGGRKFNILVGKNKLQVVHRRYMDIATDIRFELKDYEGKILAVFNEAGYLEIAIFRSNPELVGSASSLLGLSFQSAVRVNFLST